MKQFRLRTLMLLVVIAGLACALVFERIRMNRELRAQRIEAEMKELAAQQWNAAVERYVSQDPLQIGSDATQLSKNHVSGYGNDQPQVNSEQEQSKREKPSAEYSDRKP